MTIDERVEKMERQLVRLKWSNLALIACIVLYLGLWFRLKTFGPETAWARELEASSFVLVDENGKHGGVFCFDGDKGPSLMLTDENNKIHTTLGQTTDGLGLELWGENDEVRVLLTVGKDRPILSLFDENGKTIWSAP